MRMVVTGGRGFIGSHFVELALANGHSIIDIDCMQYSSHKKLPFDRNKNYKLIKTNIIELDHLPLCDVVINFAAETHVDNSIESSERFVTSNILGVHNLLELIRGKPYERPLFVQISTDEVYGDKTTGEFLETDILSPSNPYSATKAAAEHLVTSYHRTYGLDFLITRSSNNYGPRQYQEKLISKAIDCLINNKKIPLHGDGSYVRDWIYVIDNAATILKLIESNIKNEVFNISGNLLLSNNEVIEQVCKWFNITDWQQKVKYTENRLGQDLRYSISNSKLEKFNIIMQKRNELYNFLDD